MIGSLYGHMFSPNKTSDMYEKTSPRFDLRYPSILNANNWIVVQSMLLGEADISETIVKVDSQMMIQKNDVCLDDGVAASFQLTWGGAHVDQGRQDQDGIQVKAMMKITDSRSKSIDKGLMIKGSQKHEMNKDYKQDTDKIKQSI
ncbi:hypothetical protein Tco_0846390 [Tanacetum coccineum]